MINMSPTYVCMDFFVMSMAATSWTLCASTVTVITNGSVIVVDVVIYYFGLWY